MGVLLSGRGSGVHLGLGMEVGGNMFPCLGIDLSIYWNESWNGCWQRCENIV